MKIALLIGLGMMAACAPVVYTKPGGTEANYYLDSYQCKNEAGQYGAGNPFLIGEQFHDCMRLRGWRAQ